MPSHNTSITIVKGVLRRLSTPIPSIAVCFFSLAWTALLEHFVPPPPFKSCERCFCVTNGAMLRYLFLIREFYQEISGVVFRGRYFYPRWIRSRESERGADDGVGFLFAIFTVSSNRPQHGPQGCIERNGRLILQRMREKSQANRNCLPMYLFHSLP